MRSVGLACHTGTACWGVRVLVQLMVPRLQNLDLVRRLVVVEGGKVCEPISRKSGEVYDG